MSHVFVIDANKQPLNPVHPARARVLLSQGKAAVLKRFPFTIILNVAIDAPVVEELRIKIDPGSKTTGIALVNDQSGEVVFAAELHHRGAKIKEALDDRRAVRHSRRRRHTRYRKARWQNRRRREGWLPPSLTSRISNVLTWVKRLRNLCPITAMSMELVKFDMQAMENPDIQGWEYQQGTLAGYELREYLLEKWNRMCAYCGKGNVPLQVEHIVPRANKGTHRVSNLTLACEKCNQAKGTQDIKDFLKKKPAMLKHILAQAKAPLNDAAAVNATRWELFRGLQALGLPIECGSGGLTKYNRTTRELPKTHWIDAACVGQSTPEYLNTTGISSLLITATGYGKRQLCGVDKHGFPQRHRQRKKVHHGYQMGDLVRAVVPEGFAAAGRHVGRVLARATGSFDLRTARGRIEGVPVRYCRPLHRNDGYSYHSTRGGNSSPL
ncbi:RNA-guided endonuclease IscB [Ktedonobacter racemifer]|uniref:HNH endonuclease n=1 Tax=Ktedonobacter racemifer DSM 44963 TaxID=485913 RepID=D6TGA2_KTERA|nr:RNA-guided endonuclease IscB [Ktedonobacter racemifer]EFH88804.1 HNH endonuclease [Ktedonobacter racemifer DSM 44963]